MQQTGFFWHVYGDSIIDWCYSYDEHFTLINGNRPLEDQVLRIKLFQPVKGELPVEMVEAMKTVVKTKKINDEAWEPDAYGSGEAWEASIKASGEAWETYVKALWDYNKILENNLPTILALHAQECLDCPWDGKTIFSKTHIDL